MASANNLHRTSATIQALEIDSDMPPSARLWLALASLRTDHKGRTQFGAHRYASMSNDTAANGDRAIEWLNGHGIIVADYDDDGIECWRLTHHDWDADNTPTIRGEYHSNAGQPRDGLPPQYSRTVNDVIEPNGKKYHPPAGTSWRKLAEEQA